MAGIYPEIWLGYVLKKLKNTDVAAWLDGIPELSGDVTVLGEGTDTEKNIIHISSSDFEPEVLINNTAYPIALQSYTADGATIALDKYQTKVTTITDDQAMGSAFDTIDDATKGHVSSITSSKYMKAAHAISPQKDTADTPVVKTSGDVVTDGSGRKMITHADIIALKKKFDTAQVPLDGRRLVLCADHVADLLSTKDQKFANQYHNYETGAIANLYGFNVYEYIANPSYSSTTGEKLSFGAIAGADDFQASFAFYAPRIAKKTGKTKQYFRDSKIDPENQSNALNYRHYFIAMPKQNRYIGAIMSAK